MHTAYMRIAHVKYPGKPNLTCRCLSNVMCLELQYTRSGSTLSHHAVRQRGSLHTLCHQLWQRRHCKTATVNQAESTSAQPNLLHTAHTYHAMSWHLIRIMAAAAAALWQLLNTPLTNHCWSEAGWPVLAELKPLLVTLCVQLRDTLPTPIHTAVCGIRCVFCLATCLCKQRMLAAGSRALRDNMHGAAA